VHRKLGPPPESKSETSECRRLTKLTLPARTEVIVQLPVTDESPVKGLVQRTELLAGVYLAKSSQGGQ